MPVSNFFEYSVIRVVPRVEREEFLNLGVIVLCAEDNFLECRYTLDASFVSTFTGSTQSVTVQQHLAAFNLICKGHALGGPIALLDIRSRFRWLTAVRSTILQTSRVHPGLTSNPRATLDRLYAELVKRVVN